MNKPVKCTYEVMKTCKYCTTFDKSRGDVICEYILIEGHRRPCSPDACTVYEKITKEERERNKKMRKQCYGKENHR